MPRPGRSAIALLGRMPLLDGIAPGLLARLTAALETREVARRQVVYLPGDPPRTVGFIFSGLVKIARVSAEGKDLTLAFRRAGELYGEGALAGARTREECAEALDTCLVGEIALPHFQEVACASPALARRLFRLLAERRREAEARAEALVFREVPNRLAVLLLRMADAHGVSDARGILLPQHLTHQELADWVGATRETVSLTVGRWRREGWISADGRRMIVRDAAALRRLR